MLDFGLITDLVMWILISAGGATVLSVTALVLVLR